MANKTKFGFGSSSAVLQALQDGKINARDILLLDENTNNPKFGWVNLNNEPVIIDTEKIVIVEGESLPEAGVSGKIYIFGEDGYFWNGQKFVNLCKPTDVTELEAAIKALEELIVKNSEEDKAYADEAVKKALEDVKHSYRKRKYEIAGIPTGTLVNYYENEIRVMCPADAVFTKQNVGAGGDADSYYMTLKTFAPSDDAVGYIEHLGNQVDAEILTDLKVDEYGRKYQPSWLALAKCTDDVWTYYGASSSKERYIGWDYRIDWYNADGVMVESDCVRINLSNEDCHFVLEPYFITNSASTADVENAVESAKAYTDEQIAAIDSAITVVEF